MPKTSPTKTRATSAAQESFLEVAQKLGAALATVYTHPACPVDVADAISELDCRIFNHHSGVEISLRYSFAHRLTGMLNRRRK